MRDSNEGWQPASTTTPIEKAWLAIAGVTLAAAATTHPALVEARFHLLTAMGQFRRPHHLAGRLVHHRHSCGFAARIDLEPQRVRLLCLFTFPENDGEWKTALPCRPSTRQ